MPLSRTTRRVARKSAGYAYGPAMISRMAAIAGRRRRASTGGVHVLLQGRVDPAIKERADRGAAARGVSMPVTCSSGLRVMRWPTPTSSLARASSLISA